MHGSRRVNWSEERWTRLELKHAMDTHIAYRVTCELGYSNLSTQVRPCISTDDSLIFEVPSPGSPPFVFPDGRASIMPNGVHETQMTSWVVNKAEGAKSSSIAYSVIITIVNDTTSHEHIPRIP